MYVCEFDVDELNLPLHSLFHKVEILMIILRMINLIG